ncbi:MBL fold hydrolase [Euryarchaeota archaeon ex4484_162]|nr:MAG: MBL fold metallo-hydrolase [Thermoplasmata archaeon]MCD6109119.1 MBL fold metallo-hydrolase [Thermoplasmata archaeon]OYT57870.1 MAG: MBL fold hydrolase [Euryarchaeota archaeon ex4484_162]RLF62847.1 MAG: MBL fold metallo-hydrolase [Thermoplasmata archaeon]HDM25576.1 MBL fold metallo-hydrolase [Thermoplasmatales archaeon]
MSWIKFLGTAGARFVVMKQLRASGGLWVNIDETNILVDPGPGCLVKCNSSKPRLDPMDLDAIILTHRHLDHSNDVNIMVEAMTNGGFKRKGELYAPRDALEGNDPVVLKYVRNMVSNVKVLHEKENYHVRNVVFETPVKHVHGVETYGLNFKNKTGENILSLISDTRYFNGLERFYTGDIVIINVVRFKPMKNLDHLCLADAERIIRKNKPRLTVLTHFGMTMLREKPWELAKSLSKKLGVKVVAASDGMTIDLENI